MNPLTAALPLAVARRTIDAALAHAASLQVAGVAIAIVDAGARRTLRRRDRHLGRQRRRRHRDRAALPRPFSGNVPLHKVSTWHRNASSSPARAPASAAKSRCGSPSAVTT
ncbi:GlcG/HbpS family heme-binding protein [Burkholderia cenocepacia]|uniref:GlcG/HbpS family heme-binding protein n=1 Tax=Burkholderia cenocepacia TaxID=95486 RepID=UPI003D15F375